MSIVTYSGGRRLVVVGEVDRLMRKGMRENDMKLVRFRRIFYNSIVEETDGIWTWAKNLKLYAKNLKLLAYLHRWYPYMEMKQLSEEEALAYAV